MEYPLIINSSTNHVLSTFLIERPYVAVPYMLVLSVVAIAGTLGNVLILASVGVLMTKRHSVVNSYIFIGNLACSDMIVTAVINPLAIMGIIYGQDLYAGHFVVCRALASLCVVSCVVSLLSIGCIALNRYIFICKHDAHPALITPRSSVALCLLTWTVGSLLDLPSHLHWSRHWFDPKTHKCLWDRNYNYDYTVFFVTIGMLLPLAAITVLYAWIFARVSLTKARIGTSFNQTTHEAIVKTLQQTKMMFAIFAAYLFCWAPYIVVLLADRHDLFSLPTHLFTSLLAHTHASLNFVIYGLCNGRIRDAYRTVILVHICRQSLDAGPLSDDRGHPAALAGAAAAAAAAAVSGRRMSPRCTPAKKTPSKHEYIMLQDK